MDLVTQHNIAAAISPRNAAPLTSVTAGGAGDATQVVGITIDRSAIDLPRNVELSLVFKAVLAQAATLSLSGVKVQDSTDGTTFADFKVFTDPGVVATGPNGGGTVNGQVNLSAGLSGARQYVRVVFTPDLSAANTDTAIVGAVAILAGFDRFPAP